MKVIKATQQMLETRTLVLGFQGENLRTQLRIDCAATFAEYPNATPALAIKPPAGETYPVFVEREGNEVVWDIVANNLVLKGDGELQLTFYKDNVIAKTSVGHITVNRSLQIDGEMPDVVATWIENANRKLAEVDAQIVELEGMVDTATDAAERAEQSESNATTAAANAATSAATATEKATEATQAAGTATAKAAEAQTAAQTATEKANAAADSERIATAKAVEATTAATTATAKAEQATEAAQTATGKAEEASASATAAQTSATDAASSATAASASETAAKASETAAGASATQAAASAQTANTAAQTAEQKAGEAASSATNAATSATNAATSATTASTKAGEAAQSAQAVQETAEQLADSLEQIEQNTQDIADLDERKANIDGYYPDMTVGNAEQLNSSKFVENSEPYTLRTSGGTSDIGNREYLDAVVGGTVAWNQMVRDEASENQTDFAPIVTVTDAVEDAAGVKVKIEPVQDLHGYDHPWPAGGGKNLFDPSTIRDTSTTVQNSIVVSGNEITMTWINGSIVGRSDQVIPAGTYTISVVGTNAEKTLVQAVGAQSGSVLYSIPFFYNLSQTRTLSEDFKLYFFGDYATPDTAVYKIQVEAGDTSTAWTPYSNICPITGWDGVKVTKTGKNLLDNVNPVYLNGYFNNATVLANNNNRILIVPCAPNTAYAFTYNRVAISGTQTARIVSFESLPTYGMVGTKMATSVNESASATFVTGANDKYIGIHLGDIRSTDVSASVTASQLELGSTATAYEPYAGQTYDITLPTEAGTVYGGELTVNKDGTGSVVVDRASFVLEGGTSKYPIPASWYPADAERDSLGFYWYFTYQGFSDFPKPKPYTASAEIEDGWASDKLKINRYGTYGNDEAYTFGLPINCTYLGIRIPKNALSDVSTEQKAKESCMEWLQNNPVQFTYLIAEPQTYTLTASEIRTLLGQNNVWSNAGQTALTYTGTDEHLTLESGKKYLSRISGTDSMLLGSGQEITAAKGQDNVFDLTKMFGTAVADYVYGQGAAFFRRWFGKQWYPYNTGELKHVEGLESHDVVGFNLFDAEAVLVPLGFVKQSDGSLYLGRASDVQTATVLWANKAQYDGTICISYEYKNNSGSTSGGARFRFDYVDGTYSYSYPSPVATYTAYRIVSTTGKKVKQITYDFGSGATSTWLKNVCVNFSHNNSRNGEYEPYEKHSYPLDSSVILRGIPKVGANGVYWDGDRYLPDGTVERRYGVVDLGAFGWQYNSTYAVFFAKLGALQTSYGYDGICSAYAKYTGAGKPGDKQWGNTGFIGGGINLLVVDSSYTDPATFKAAMQGVLLVYELATPTIETAQPYHSTQWVSDWGTEEFVSTSIVPVGTETRYPANLRDKLQHLPDAASGNGSYLITQTDGQMVLTPFPAPPSSAGNYVLKATVTNGVATYTWEVAT